MLDIKTIRDNPEAVLTALRKKVPDLVLDDVIALDAERRSLLLEVEGLKNERNVVSKEIGRLKKSGEDISEIQKAMREVGERIGRIDDKVREVEAALHEKLLAIPNMPHPDVPEGADETANREVKMVGKPVEFPFEPKPHWDLAEKLGLLDFERATKITGAGFPLFRGLGARLERALIQFMLDLHVTEHGYTEISPPFVCNTAAMTGTGQLPKMEEDMYAVSQDDLYLIPTAEVPVTNIYRDEIIEESLPIRLTAYTPCFRREAGAAGKDTRGLNRVHQFDKVELVKFVEPADSYDELEKLLADAEVVLQRLGLHYRVIELCAGDLSFAAAKCYDIELWAPGQQKWLEVSSCSNFESFQARRANIRYRNAEGKTTHVHTLNGS
ncbi:MAG: serine--tRNA ligase, partial [Verrucomicrobia bacterium]|nr:serine--tRNA ligase [Verrucomicrobiota bacterium]